MVNKTLPWPGAESLLRAQDLQRKQQQSLGRGENQNPVLTPHVLWMISTPDGSFSPTSIQPSPRSQVVPLCLAASGLQQSLLPPLCQSSCAPEALLAVSVYQLSTHTVDSDFSSTLENKKGDAGQNNSNFWLVSGAQVCLHRQLSCAAAGNGLHTCSA